MPVHRLVFTFPQVCGAGKSHVVDPTSKTELRNMLRGLQAAHSPWLINDNFNDGFDSSKGCMPLILMCSEVICECGADLKVVPRPSTIKVYTVDGLQEGHSFHKKCGSCQTSYYLSFKVNETGRYFHSNAHLQPYLMISLKTGFGTKFLHFTSNSINTSALSFTAAAEIYLLNHGKSLEEQRLEEGFFLWHLLHTYKEMDCQMAVHFDEESCRKDIERLCRGAVQHLFLQDTFQDHICNTPGCREGFVMADGVEKVSLSLLVHYDVF